MATPETLPKSSSGFGSLGAHMIYARATSARYCSPISYTMISKSR